MNNTAFGSTSDLAQSAISYQQISGMMRELATQPLPHQPTQPMPVNPAPNPMWISNETAYTSGEMTNALARLPAGPEPIGFVEPALVASKPIPSIKHTQPTKPLPPNKLPFRVGLELTAVYKNHLEIPCEGYSYTDASTQSHCHAIERRINLSYPMRNHPVHVDGHCIEWSTKTMTTWEEVEKTYNEFHRQCRRWDFYPRHPDVVCGGGHIHVKLDSMLQCIRLRDFCWAYPVIPWIFLHPCDTDSGNNPGTEWGHKAAHVYGKDKVYHTKSLFIGLGGGQNSTNKPIIEFRCFEAAETWEEQKLHLDFALAIAQYIRNTHNMHIDAPFYDAEQLSKITKRQALKMFESLCALIGFDASRCASQIKRNLNVRYHKGYQRT